LKVPRLLLLFVFSIIMAVTADFDSSVKFAIAVTVAVGIRVTAARDSGGYLCRKGHEGGSSDGVDGGVGVTLPTGSIGGTSTPSRSHSRSTRTGSGGGVDGGGGVGGTLQ
jgi:hypothetical protein